MREAIESLGSPPAVTIDQIASRGGDLAAWLKARQHRRSIPGRLKAAGYVAVGNPGAVDGLWRIGDKRVVVYGKADLPVTEQLAAAGKLMQGA